jgi:hypothetical protein
MLDAAQAATFGGKAGARADPWCHLACDGLANVDLPLARLLTAGLAEVATPCDHDVADPALNARCRTSPSGSLGTRT